MAILLVDDDRKFLEEIAEGLMRKGHVCVLAGSAEVAIEQFHDKPEINVIVTDLNLPNMGGLEMIRKLSIWSRQRRFSSVIVTGHATFDSAITALRAHAIDLLQKPVSVEEVHAAIETAMQLPVQTRETEIDSGPDELLRRLITARTERDRTFADRAISDIAWHMLLEIAYAEAGGIQISVSSACIASGAPAATALRHLRALEHAELVVRTPDMRDRRSIRLALTSEGRERIEKFLKRLSQRNVRRANLPIGSRDGSALLAL